MFQCFLRTIFMVAVSYQNAPSSYIYIFSDFTFRSLIGRISTMHSEPTRRPVEQIPSKVHISYVVSIHRETLLRVTVLMSERSLALFIFFYSLYLTTTLILPIV